MITTRGPMNSSIQLPDHSAALGSNAKENPASPNSALVPWHLVFSLHFLFPCPIYESIGLLVFIRQVPANRGILAWGNSWKVFEDLKFHRGLWEAAQILSSLRNHHPSCLDLEKHEELARQSYAVEKAQARGHL